MCGIACFLSGNNDEGSTFGRKAIELMRHRGPDDHGIYQDEGVTLIHRRLSIVELSALGHQPMESSNGRYIITFNGEIYNHLELRNRYLSSHHFKGHSDTETIVELFSTLKEKMFEQMVGMWAIVIWDKKERKALICRDRYGQKPIYVRRRNNTWKISSEVTPLLEVNERPDINPTAIAEFLSTGNYGHLGRHTFYRDIYNFQQGSYAWLSEHDPEIRPVQYWELPRVNDRDKVPFTKTTEKELHDVIVQGVLSQTMADVPIGITLSGGIDSSIVAGILASYYDRKTHVFTAQAPNSHCDETMYVDAVIEKFGAEKFIMHRKNLNTLSAKEDIEKYVAIQEEPFGDPSIIAHGFLMNMAAEAGIKVILNGQGADELFYGYDNMAQAILLKQMRSLQISKFLKNVNTMQTRKGYFSRTLLKSFLPALEHKLRIRSRNNRRSILHNAITTKVEDEMIALYKYDNLYDVWKESFLGVHIPHLVHYDDRNGMACSVEGRMPFLDHRIADVVAKIKPEAFLEQGLRKYLLRKTCKKYLPELIYNRTDKLGFYTPILTAVQNDKDWVKLHLDKANLVTATYKDHLLERLNSTDMNSTDALLVWRLLIVNIWMEHFNCNW